MKVIETVAQFRDWRSSRPVSLGFVPTMGALHPGHMSLVERSQKDCECTAISIFVNPTQFNDPKDLEKYPRPLENDLQMAQDAGVDAVFLPQANELYADLYRYQLRETKLSQILCGATRPGHFEGMLTIVLKLLLITNPTRAYFGEKDYQQFQLIHQMSAAFFLPCEIIGLPILREIDGLAMSSRNVRLSERERQIAPMIYQQLKSNHSLSEVRQTLEAAGFRIDYLEEHFGRRFIAAFLGEVRLIDNV